MALHLKINTGTDTYLGDSKALLLLLSDLAADTILKCFILKKIVDTNKAKESFHISF